MLNTDMFELKGKVALVTGAASGIGFAYVKELLRNELKGVALVDIDAVKGEHALKEVINEFGQNRAIFLTADVSDKNQFENAFEATVKTFKQLDIVVNNAGIVQERQWDKCVAVNLLGVITGSMLAMEKYLPKYRSGFEGVIVNTASILGLKPLEEIPTYAATKHGVVGFTRAIGGDMHYQTSKVRVLAICPGLTETAIINVTEEQVSEPYMSLFLNTVKTMPGQPPEALAKNLIKVIREAPTGSIRWEHTVEHVLTQAPINNLKSFTCGAAVRGVVALQCPVGGVNFNPLADRKQADDVIVAGRLGYVCKTGKKAS